MRFSGHVLPPAEGRADTAALDVTAVPVTVGGVVGSP
jgi:hypothetical protein